jgi:hypothetical protein
MCTDTTVDDMKEQDAKQLSVLTSLTRLGTLTLELSHHWVGGWIEGERPTQVYRGKALQLPVLPSVTSLTVHPVTGRCNVFKMMASLPALTCLDISGNAASLPLPETGEWTKLQRLSIDTTYADESRMAARRMLLATLPSELRSLAVQQIGSREFVTLARYTMLTRLEVFSPCRVPASDFGRRQYEGEGVSMLTSLGQMQELRLAIRCGSAPLIAALAGMPVLRSLDLTGSVGLQPPDALAIAQAAIDKASLTVLDLSDVNKIGEAADVWERRQFSEMLSLVTARASTN